MNKLNPEQWSILKQFIQKFLPQRGNKRKNSGNELDYVSITLNRVFIQHFGFNLERYEVIDAFEELGYQTFEREEEIDYDAKTSRPVINGTNKIKKIGVGNRLEAPFTFIDISAKTVRNLMRATATLPETTNPQKSYEVEKLKRELEGFKQSLKN